jgi:outer membrane murein-binding lipoprotein Lpp
MATVTAKIQCFSCRKETRTFKCEGCSQSFCLNCLTIHVQTLSKQFDEIENDHDQFRQKFNDQKNDPKKHPLIQQIDKWKKDSINKIEQTAKECKQKLINYTNKYFIDIENKLNDIGKEIIQIRQQNEFNEIDLNQFKDNLNKLKEELDKSSNISIQEDSSIFINKIFVFISSNKGNQFF